MAKWVYYNANTDGNNISDCVTRAIMLATGCKYADIRRKLYHISKLFNCTKLCHCCYKHLLENVFNYKRVFCKGMTVKQFAELHPFGKYIIRIPYHLTTIIDGVLYDTFNCLDGLCDIVWKVE